MRSRIRQQTFAWIAILTGVHSGLAVVVNGAAPVTLKVMTFNIKNASTSLGFDQQESWDYAFSNSNDRRDRVVSVIDMESPDILGVQELKSLQLDYMDDRLTDYFYYGVSRDTGTNSDSGERSGIFYKKSRFRNMGQGQFWLSSTPTVPGTVFAGNGGDTNNPRMATWLKLLDNQSNQTYFVINTHWSLDSVARQQGGALMRDMILELGGGLPVIVTGDFNETAGGAAYAALARRRSADEFNLSNSYFQSGAPSGKTFHNYDGGVDGSPIDHVLHSDGNFTSISGNIVRTTFGGYYPSDHYPLDVVLQVIPIPGDYDHSGAVDANDYSVWRQTLGSMTALDADGNGNGIVDAVDYVIWRNRMQAASGASANFVAPEPAAGITTMFVVISMLLGRAAGVRRLKILR